MGFFKFVVFKFVGNKLVKALTSGKYLKLSVGALLLTWSSASFVVASHYNPPALNTQDLNNAPVHESAPILDLNEINAKLQGHQSALKVAATLTPSANGSTAPILRPNFKHEERKEAALKLHDLTSRKAQLNEKQPPKKSSSLFATFAISATQDNDASLLKKQASFLAALPPQDIKLHSVRNPQHSALEKDNPAVTLSKTSASSDEHIASTNIFDKPLSSERMEYLSQEQQEYLSSQTMLAEVSSLASQIDKNFIQSSTVSSIQDSQDEIFELNAENEAQTVKEASFSSPQDERLSTMLESEGPQSFYEEDDEDTSDEVIFIQGSTSTEETEQTQYGNESLITHSVPSLEISDLDAALFENKHSDEASKLTPKTHLAPLPDGKHQTVEVDTPKSAFAKPSKQPNLDAHGELYNSDFMAEQFITLNLPALEAGTHTDKDELTEEYEAYDEVLEHQEQERIYKSKNRILYEGTLPSAYTDEIRTASDNLIEGHKFLSIPKEALENEGPPRLYYDTNANNLSFSERADLDFYLNDANAPRPHYDENSHYGLDEIEVDPSVDLNDFKTFSDDNTLLYNSILDSLDHSDGLLLDSESKDSSPAAPVRQKQRQIHSSHEKYLENLIYQDHRRYANDFAKSIPNDSKYDPKNFNWEVKMQSAQTESSLGKNYNTHNNKESDVIYSSMHVDISNHLNDQTNDIDEEHINDYVIATNEEGESPWGNDVVTRTRITTYALRFNDNPFLTIEKLQKKQSSCINGKGYSCYLVGRHYDGLASLGRNNKNRMIAASELAKAHELYPHIAITGADFDHLLHTIVFFRRGCHLKHSLSCRLLLSTYGRYGGLIALGKTTVSDKQLGVRYLETGCKFEEPRSCANLAAMHINGYGTFEANTKQGINYYVRSCRIARTVTNELRLIDPNLGIGCLELGRMYLYGAAFKDGGVVAQNYIKAHHYLHYACNLRSAAGCKMLKDNFTNHEYIKIPNLLNRSYDCRDLDSDHKNTNTKIMVTPLNLGIGLGEDNLKIGKTKTIEDEEEEEEDFYL